MNSRGLIDLYMPRRLAYHVKIVLASLLFPVIFIFVKEGKFWGEGSIHMFFLLFIQLEFFLWFGRKFFEFKEPPTLEKVKRKAILRLIIFYLLAFIISSVVYLSYLTIVYLINGWDLKELIPNILDNEIKGFIIGASSGYIFGAVLFFYFQWVDALKREQALKEEKLIFQYETLKSQVNPHFLFNSLNTLSSLVYKDADLSDEFIRRLSSIYRYILENMDIGWVDLEKELGFAKNYFYLQQVRDNGKIDLKMDISNPGKYYILPISLQMLMENALKHNAATRERPLIIEISLNETEDKIIVKNNLNPKKKIEQSSRIGLRNLNERIKLTLHKEMDIQETAHEFIVKVPLKVKKNESSDH